MKSPTVKRLISDLNISKGQAKTVRGLIKGDIEPETVERTANWIRQCFNRPSDDELLMHAIDATLETFGVEAVWIGDSQDNGIKGEFCNAGDPYVATIMRRPDGWGGWNAPYIGSQCSLVG